MEGAAATVCEILRYLIIYWKCETAGISKRTLLEGQLVISIEALNSKYQANVLHCVITIASAESKYGVLVLKKFQREIQSLLPGLSAKLTWASEEASRSLDTSGLPPFQMTFEVDEEHRTLMMDCLDIKYFLHRVIMVHPKIKCNFSVKVNGTLSEENFGVENEPILNLPNGIALVANCQRYVSQPELGATELLCSRIHSVPVQPVTLSIPDDVASMGLPSQLILTPAAALCPCSKVFPNKTNRISSVSVFLYGPSALPLILTSRAQPTAIFTDIARLIDWKKHHLCVVPNLDFSLVGDSVLPDVSFQIESCAGALSQSADVQGQTLLLFFFLDFHSGFPVHHMELCGVHALLTTHFHAILLENQQVIQDSIQTAVDQALEQCHQAAKTHQKLRVAQAVAVNSIMSVVLGSTSSSFRRMCFQALQAADSKEFGTKLHKAFNRISQHRFLHHCSCEVKQLPSKKDMVQNTEDRRWSSSSECLSEPSGQAERKRQKTDAQTRPFGCPLAAPSCPMSPGPTTGEAGTEQGNALGLEDALWLQEVANLSEWLSASP